MASSKSARALSSSFLCFHACPRLRKAAGVSGIDPDRRAKILDRLVVVALGFPGITAQASFEWLSRAQTHGFAEVGDGLFQLTAELPGEATLSPERRIARIETQRLAEVLDRLAVFLLEAPRTSAFLDRLDFLRIPRDNLVEVGDCLVVVRCLEQGSATLVKVVRVRWVSFDRLIEICDGFLVFAVKSQHRSSVEVGTLIVWIQPDGLGIFGNRAFKLAHGPPNVASTDIRSRKLGIDLDGVIKVVERLVKILFHHPHSCSKHQSCRATTVRFAWLP